MWLSGVFCLDPTAATNCRSQGIDSAAVSYSLDLIHCHQEITDGPAATCSRYRLVVRLIIK